MKEMRSLSRLLIAAARSGSGKTIVTCGLLEILKRRGLSPVSFKCGPDYIDPMFHAQVLSVPGRNLDSFFLGKDGIRRLLFETAKRERAGIAVLEGVMGYYDGIGGVSLKASSWEMADLTETPAVLVLDCRGMSLSAAAQAAGFVRFRRDSRIGGLILNRVSSSLYEPLAAAIEEAAGVPVLGYLPVSEEFSLESRHLGLLLPGEIRDLRGRIGALADAMEHTVKVDALLSLARSAPPQEVFAGERIVRPPGQANADAPPAAFAGEGIFRPSGESAPLRIGVARDEAFCFYYRENLDLLAAMGAEPVFFSPLRDPRLPAGICGLILGGGYPENAAAALEQNESMRRSVREAAAGGLPFLAECGGFLYLHRTLEGSDGKPYAMAGVYGADAYRSPALKQFGYVTLRDETGLSIRGHEFHYWQSRDPGKDWLAVKPAAGKRPGKSWRCLHGNGAQIGGFAHLYYLSNPEFLRRWLARCRAFAKKEAGHEG